LTKRSNGCYGGNHVHHGGSYGCHKPNSLWLGGSHLQGGGNSQEEQENRLPAFSPCPRQPLAYTERHEAQQHRRLQRQPLTGLIFSIHS
jgi:hypothetical protein